MAEPSEKVLSTEQLVTLIRLLKGADSAELKLSVPEDAQRSAIAALGMDALDAQIRQVVFFDTPDLTLQKAGVVVRARRVQGKPGDAIVKLRPVDPERVPASLRKLPEFGIEVDAMPGGFVCSGRLKAAVDGLDVKAVVDGQRPIRKLFTKEQRALYAQHAPEGVGLDDLAVLGPLFVLKLKVVPQGLDRRMVAEMWFYPDGTRLLELSTKCLPTETFDVAAQARAFLGSRGVDLLAEQETKTRRALEFFAAELAPPRPGHDPPPPRAHQGRRRPAEAACPAGGRFCPPLPRPRSTAARPRRSIAASARSALRRPAGRASATERLSPGGRVGKHPAARVDRTKPSRRAEAPTAGTCLGMVTGGRDRSTTGRRWCGDGTWRMRHAWLSSGPDRSSGPCSGSSCSSSGSGC